MELVHPRRPFLQRLDSFSHFLFLPFVLTAIQSLKAPISTRREGKTFMNDNDWLSFEFPTAPSKLTYGYRRNVTERLAKRINVLADRIGNVGEGRVVSSPDEITIGSGRQLELSILFLDICGFSTLANWSFDEHKRVLALMNIFMAEMLSIVRDFGGTFEKNTGDGLMAYFGEGCISNDDRVKPAVEAAVTMHYVNDEYLTPQLTALGLPPVTFRIGTDVGPITLAKVGVSGGTHNSLVAIGTPANVACKLMNLIPAGGICIGDFARRHLPNNWPGRCTKLQAQTGFIYRQDNTPYPAWTLDYRIPRNDGLYEAFLNAASLVGR